MRAPGANFVILKWTYFLKCHAKSGDCLGKTRTGLVIKTLECQNAGHDLIFSRDYRKIGRRSSSSGWWSVEDENSERYL